MDISDNDLGMLEQLTYMSPDVAKAAGIENYEDYPCFNGGETGMTVGELLDCFDEDALYQLEYGEKKIHLPPPNPEETALEKFQREQAEMMLSFQERNKKPNTEAVDGIFVSGAEWAEIIRYLQKSDLKDLTLSSTLQGSDGDTLALCFTEDGNEQEAIVAFRGTSGGDEWYDNVEGLNVSDTPCQLEALNYIEGLPYGNITVTGHSKGSNKAMYVAITSDKVTRCVGYDGQGFSQEFIDKYWAEIEARGVNITNYSVSTDFVHILLYPVPNSNQVFCKGFGINSAGEHHSPNSLFTFDEDGNPQVVITDEDESMQMLHQFTTFILNNADDEDKVVLVEYLAPLVAMIFDGDEMSDEARMNTITASPDAVALTLAYFVKYTEVAEVSSDDLIRLALVLLGNEYVDWLDPDTLTTDSSFGEKAATVGKGALSGTVVMLARELIEILQAQLRGEMGDINTQLLGLSLLQLLLPEGMSAHYIWNKAKLDIQRIDTTKGCADAVNRTGKTRDFSKKVYDALMDASKQIEDAGAASVSAWNSYSGESWFTSLLVGVAAKGINKYFTRLTETNEECKTKIDNVFDAVEQVDSNAATGLKSRCTELETINTAISGLADSVG